MNGYYTRIHNYNFTSYLIIEMKAYEITTTTWYNEKPESHIFKNYENALKRRMKQRAENLSNWHSESRFWISWNSKKMSRIKEIEVPDDYWKKDFWEYLDIGWNFWFWKKPKNDWWQKHTEDEFLHTELYFINHYVRCSTVVKWWLDRNNLDVKMIIEDSERWMSLKNLPKQEMIQLLRDCFLSCWRLLERLDNEDIISERTRWMYEDEYKEYCERMDKLQQELIEEMK